MLSTTTDAKQERYNCYYNILLVCMSVCLSHLWAM